MDLIEELKKAKEGNSKAYENILDFYKNYIFFLMNRYGIDDKEDCYDIVTHRIMKSVLIFKIEE